MSTRAAVTLFVTPNSSGWLKLAHEQAARALLEGNLWSKVGEGKDDSRVSLSHVYLDSRHFDVVMNTPGMKGVRVETSQASESSPLLGFPKFELGYLGMSVSPGMKVKICGSEGQLAEHHGADALVKEIAGKGKSKFVLMEFIDSEESTSRMLVPLQSFYERVLPRPFDSKTFTPEIRHLLGGEKHKPFETGIRDANSSELKPSA